MTIGKPQQQGRAGALIEKIQTDASEEAATLLAEAKKQADGITREAHRKARLKIHEVVEKLRSREEREMAHEAARFETERRQWRQADEMSALAEGLSHLEAALTGLWDDQNSRKQWCRNVIAVAQQRLPAKEWRLEHPADYPLDELEMLNKTISAHSGIAPECRVGDKLHAGIRIFAGTACVDGSVEAITSDRKKTSALFLGILLTMKEADTP